MSKTLRKKSTQLRVSPREVVSRVYSSCLHVAELESVGLSGLRCVAGDGRRRLRMRG